MSELIRSFIAFDIDDAKVMGQLENAQASLAKTGADLKLVEPKNIHMTLRFLGGITAAMVDKVYEQMKKVVFSPFDVKIVGLGAFPNERYPRVVWAGMAEGASQLRNIFHQLEPGIRELGLAPDSKGFSPHLTIARVRSGRNKVELARFLLGNKNFEFGSVRAEHLRFKRSDLTPTGPIYSTLREYTPQRQ